MQKTELNLARECVAPFRQLVLISLKGSPPVSFCAEVLAKVEAKRQRCSGCSHVFSHAGTRWGRTKADWPLFMLAAGPAGTRTDGHWHYHDSARTADTSTG
eukprot:3755634-Rhodomonas_salina.1